MISTVLNVHWSLSLVKAMLVLIMKVPLRMAPIL